jgi:nicotinate-nucleotide--dimethylbenzimidazole phosphoribosyltransferase
MTAFVEALAHVGPPDARAAADAQERHDRLTKPRGALGRLEALGVRLAAMSGQVPPPVPAPAAVAVFAADHGVLAEGVSPWPKEVTAQMVANFLAGGAAINVLARQMNATVTVVDVGVDADLPDAPGLVGAKVRRGTRNLAREAALVPHEVDAALDVGASVAASLVAAGARTLVTGDMGIGNTTASAGSRRA